MKFIRKIRNGVFGFSALFIVLGLFLFVEPNTSALIITYVFGGIILACALIDLINYMVNKKQRKFFRFDLIKGAVLLTLGLFIVIRPDLVSAILPTVFGLVLLFDGIAKVLSSFDIRSGGDKSWIPIIVFGFITCILGLLVILNPFVLVSLSMRIIGLSLICDGASNFWCNLCLKKRIKQK